MHESLYVARLSYLHDCGAMLLVVIIVSIFNSSKSSLKFCQFDAKTFKNFNN